MATAPVFLHDPSSLEHDTGPHPESAPRIIAIERELAQRGWARIERARSPEVDLATLELVHPSEYVVSIAGIAARGGGQLDPDTVMSAGSYEAALHAAGGAVALVDMLLDGDFESGFSAHRPPGHHALSTRAMGFCLFNNIAVAARHAVAERGLERVMILDWDVHHGNGTNDILHADPSVLFVSIHQYPMYPGTGHFSDAGSGAGIGYTVNLPVPSGSGDDVFCSLVDRVAVPLARAYEPQLVLISAGFDAHVDDPLASCRVTEAGYAAMTASMFAVAAELGGVPVGAVLEGGYDLGALSRSVATVLDVMAREVGAVAPAPATALSDAAVERLGERWPGLVGGSRI